MAKLIPAAFDMETYYDDDYSLRKMTPEEYIRDERFQIIGCAVQPRGKRSVYITGKTEEEIKNKLRSMKWDQVYAFGHNMIGFDSLILTEKVGVRPRFWGCTLSMAGQVHGGVPHPKSGRPSLSLEALAHHYDLPRKKSELLGMVKGMRLEDLTPDLQQVMAAYGNHDAELCSALFYNMKPHMPPEDMRLIHWFIRMFAEPRIDLDVGSYRTWLAQMKLAKEKLLASVGIDLKVLRSNPKFAELLRSYGVEPPVKISKTTKQETYAFAKTDKGMTALLNHPDEVVQALVEARLKTKSSIHETRTERFIGIGGRGKLPVPIVWGKTHTLRAAGAGKLNMQNLSKGKEPDEKTLPGTLIATDKGLRTFAGLAEDPSMFRTNEGQEMLVKDSHQFNLRDGLMAPPGYKWVVCDSSNIELRVAHCLAGQMDTVEKLRAGVDLYCDFAGDMYHRVITKADKKERQHGKVGMLQLQYQSGGGSFREAARIMGGVMLTEDESQDTVDFYRQRFPMLPKFWKRCQSAIRSMHKGDRVQLDDFGLIHTEHNKLVLPRGRFIEYKNLRQINDEDFGKRWVYDDRYDGRMKNLYGGAMFENICQALAGIIVMDQCMTLEMQYGSYRSAETGMVLTVHDEGGMIVKDCDAPGALKRSIEVMSTSPSWWPEVPLAAEGDIAQRYGSAK